jgi:two-component system KDP operon response regulator KdpE
MSRILIVEDDERIRSSMRLALEDEGYTVDDVGSGEEAVERFAEEPAELVLIDLMLPGMDGFEACRALRRSSSVPVIMVTARSDTHDVVAGLEAGADDYVTKPFNMEELLARLRAALRRATPDPQPVALVETPHFRIDLVNKRVADATGTEIRLTPTQWHLVEILVRNPDRLVSQRQLLEDVWGPTYVDQTNYLRQFMAQLRRKLEPDPARPRYFVTEPGMGVRFVPALPAQGVNV